MITLEQIKSDLREIRYYYLRKEKLDDASYSIGSIPIKELLENYNCVACIFAGRHRKIWLLN